MCLKKTITNYFQCAINKSYQSIFHPIPTTPREKLFQFLDSANEPSMEIACIDFECRLCKDVDNNSY